MKILFLPKQKAAVVSVILFAVEVLLLAYFFLMVRVFHQTGGDTFFSNLNLALPMLAAWASGLGALVSGLIAAIHFKSRSILGYLIILITFLTTLYGILAVLP